MLGRFAPFKRCELTLRGYLYANSSAVHKQPDEHVEVRHLVYKGKGARSAPGTSLYMHVNFTRGFDEVAF